MVMPISPTTTTKSTHYHHHHPLRTAHSFSAEPAVASPLAPTSTKGDPSSSSSTIPSSSKMDDSGAFSLVGHLRSLSLPASDHPMTFRKRS
jgi:hypothetical protein